MKTPSMKTVRRRLAKLTIMDWLWSADLTPPDGGPETIGPSNYARKSYFIKGYEGQTIGLRHAVHCQYETWDSRATCNCDYWETYKQLLPRDSTSRRTLERIERETS